MSRRITEMPLLDLIEEAEAKQRRAEPPPAVLATHAGWLKITRQSICGPSVYWLELTEGSPAECRLVCEEAAESAAGSAEIFVVPKGSHPREELTDESKTAGGSAAPAAQDQNAAG